MSLAIINGSPRGVAGNSGLFSSQLREDLSRNHEIIDMTLSKVKDRDISKIRNASGYILVLPLYTDMMPGIVKDFLENLEDEKVHFKNKPFWFFIHSGFPESKQSRLLERYFGYFCRLMNLRYMGCAIMGNSTMVIESSPGSRRLKGIRKHIKAIARDISNGKEYNQKSLKFFSMFENLPLFSIWLFNKTSIGTSFLNKAFSKNESFKNNILPKMYDRPHLG